MIPVIRREHDDRIVSKSESIHGTYDFSDLRVHVRDEWH
jgi:hypothetical protein